MRSKTLWLVILISVFISGIFIGIRFAPSEEEIQIRYMARSLVTQTSIPKQYSDEIPFPIPVYMLSVVPKEILMSSSLFRLPNFIMGTVFLILLFWLVANVQPKLALGIITITAVTPWFLWISLSNFTAIVTLTFALVIVSLGIRKSKLTPLIIFLITLTSIPGLVFGLISGIWYAWKCNSGKKKLFFIITVMIMISGIVYFMREFISKQNLISTNDINEANITYQVDQRVRNEFRINDYHDAAPLILKRLVYNKVYFAYRALTGSMLNVFNPDKYVYPGEDGATVTRSMWNSKGLPWILFWEFVLVIWGLYKMKYIHPQLKNISLIFFTWCVITMYLFPNDFLANGMGLVIPVSIFATYAIYQLPKIVVYCFGIVIAFSLIATFHFFIFNELYWRDNRPNVYLTSVQMGIKYQANTITTILGRSFLYYAWLKQMTPNELWTGTMKNNIFGTVKFDHFNLKEKKSIKGQILVGFPGEFLGDKKEGGINSFSEKELPGNFQLLESYPIHDTVSFGNGDYLWAIKIN